MSFAGKVAVVTGAGGGMGLNIARDRLAFAQRSVNGSVNGGAKRDHRGGIC